MQASRKLTAHIAVPVALGLALLYVLLSVFVLSAISSFTRDRIDRDLATHAREIQELCDYAFDGLMHSGKATDPVETRFKKAMTLGQIEDYLRQQNLEGMVVSIPDGATLLASRGLADISLDLPEPAPGQTHGEALLSGRDYYTLRTAFAPWSWRLVVMVPAQGYDHLKTMVLSAYLSTGLLLAAALAAFLLWANRSLSRPVAEIVTSLEKGQPPRYRGIAEFEAVSDGVQRMMADLERTMEDLRELEDVVERSPVVVLSWRNSPGRPVEYVSANVRQFGYAAEELTSGAVRFGGKDVYAQSKRDIQKMRTRMQIIFQDPYSSLNPRLPVSEIVGEAMLQHRIVRNKREMQDRVVEVIGKCGLFPEQATRFPHQFSGGQRQRICIARALAVNPEFIVCDEAVSALDVSIQSQIINLLKDMQEELGLTYLFISHDLSVVKFISDDVGVMYLGQIVEMGPKKMIFSNPLHPYTEALLSAAPSFDPTARRSKKRMLLEGDIPSPANPPSGCRFHTRCPYKRDICTKQVPEYRELEPGHFAMCHKANGLF